MLRDWPAHRLETSPEYTSVSSSECGDDMTGSDQVSHPDLPVMNTRSPQVAARSWIEFGILGCGQVLTVAGAIATIRILTGLLPPAAYGDLALALTVASCLSLVGSGSIGNAVGRFFSVAHEASTLRSFFWASVVVFVQYHMGACCIALVGLLLYWAFGTGAGWLGLGLAAVIISIIQGANGLLDAAQNAARHRIAVAWHQAAVQWARVLGAVLLIRWLGATAANALWGYTAASVLILGSQYLFFKVQLYPLVAGEPKEEKARTRSLAEQMRGYANPFVAFAGLAWLQQASDRWFLALLGSRAEVGLYQTLNQVGYAPLTQLAGLLNLVAAPILFAQAGDAADDKRLHLARTRVRQLGALMCGGTVALTGILWMFGTSILSLVVAPEYRGIARYLHLAALAGGFYATGQVLSTDALVRFNSKELIPPKIGTAILAVALNYLGARWFGLPGVVWAGVISMSVYMLWMWMIACGWGLLSHRWKSVSDCAERVSLFLI